MVLYFLYVQLYQQYPVSEELFLEDLQHSSTEQGYSHRCRCGGHFTLPTLEATSTRDSEVAVLCDNCSLAVIVILPQCIIKHNTIDPSTELIVHDDSKAASKSTNCEDVQCLESDESLQKLQDSATLDTDTSADTNLPDTNESVNIENNTGSSLCVDSSSCSTSRSNSSCHSPLQCLTSTSATAESNISSCTNTVNNDEDKT